MRVIHAVSSFVAVAIIAACTLATKGDDGGSCSSDEGCKSGTCYEGACAGSTCGCSGTCPAEGGPSSDCSSGWVCVYYPPDAITGFFGASGESKCAPTCGHCPEHWSCTDGATLCSYDSSWTSPQVTIDGPTMGIAGESLAFHADATSAVGAKIVTYAWSFDSSDMATPQSADATHVFAYAGEYTVQVLVTDDGSGSPHSPNGSAMIEVTICAPAGQSCVDSSSCCGARHARVSRMAGRSPARSVSDEDVAHEHAILPVHRARREAPEAPSDGIAPRRRSSTPPRSSSDRTSPRAARGAEPPTAPSSRAGTLGRTPSMFVRRSRRGRASRAPPTARAPGPTRRRSCATRIRPWIPRGADGEPSRGAPLRRESEACRVERRGWASGGTIHLVKVDVEARRVGRVR